MKSLKIKFLGISIWLLILFVTDRVMKQLAFAEKITIVKNYGLVFGININDSFVYIYFVLMVVIILIVLFLTVHFALKKHEMGFICFGYIAVGALSNFFDRVNYGFVIDYINWGLFYNNFADVYICIATICLILLFVGSSKKRLH